MRADDVRRELRLRPAHDLAAALQLIDSAVVDAQRRGDTHEVADLSILAALRLDSQGRLDEALARLEFGLGAAALDPAGSSHLLCVRAGILAIAGRMAEASRALEEAEGIPLAEAEGRALLERDAYRATCSAIALDEVALGHAHRVVADAQRLGFDWLASGLVTWLIPWLTARGLGLAARTWVDWLRAHSSSVDHRFRLADAESLQLALNVIGGVEAGTPSLQTALAENPYALRRLLLVRLRRALLVGDLAEAGSQTSDLRVLTGQMNPGFRDGASAFQALIEAYAGLDLAPLSPPSRVTLVTLPAWLAGGEATALGGTRSEAERWAGLVADALPAGVVTSLEWPVDARRVLGLLNMRAGRRAEAVVLVEEAARASERRGDDIEAALARLQLEQWAALGVSPVQSRPADRAADPLADRAVTHARLAGAGIPVGIHAFAAARTLSGLALRGGGLTPREVEVLRLLAAGLTYREVAEQLGIGWRTVQTHAHRVYRKLDVDGRFEAVERARERRVI